jgi:hypothetical protein
MMSNRLWYTPELNRRYALQSSVPELASDLPGFSPSVMVGFGLFKVWTIPRAGLNVAETRTDPGPIANGRRFRSRHSNLRCHQFLATPLRSSKSSQG